VSNRQECSSCLQAKFRSCLESAGNLWERFDSEHDFVRSKDSHAMLIVCKKRTSFWGTGEVQFETVLQDQRRSVFALSPCLVFGTTNGIIQAIDIRQDPLEHTRAHEGGEILSLAKRSQDEFYSSGSDLNVRLFRIRNGKIEQLQLFQSSSSPIVAFQCTASKCLVVQFLMKCLNS